MKKLRKKFFKENLDLVLAVLMFISFIGGIWGWLIHFEQNDETIYWFSYIVAFYKSLQLFVLEADFDNEGVPLVLNITRFTSPLLLASAIIQQVLTYTSRTFNQWKVKFNFNDHYLICGLGAVGYRIAQDSLKMGHRVVVIEKQENNPNIEVARELGAVVFIGDATDMGALRKAALHRSRAVFAVTENDSVNIQVSLLAKEISENNKGNKGHIRCIVHVAEMGAYNLTYNTSFFQEQNNERFYPRVVNINHLAGKKIMEQYPPDKFVSTNKVGDPPINIMIIGLGNVGENVLINFALLGQYLCNIPKGNSENKILIPNKVFIVDSDAHRRMDQISALYPRLSKIIDWEILDKTPIALRELDLAEITTNNPVSVVYLCLEEDADRFGAMQMLKQYNLRHNVNIINVLSEKSGINFWSNKNINVFEENNYKVSQYKIFNIIGETCKAEYLLNEMHDDVAKILNCFDPYSENKIPLKREIDDKWKEKSEFFRQSSRYSAEHLKVKVRAMGLDWDSVTPTIVNEVLAQDPDLALKLEHLEHIRFVCERFVDGWEATTVEQDQLTGEELKKLKSCKVNKTLKPFHQLTDGEKNYNKLYIQHLGLLIEKIKEIETQNN